MQLRKKQVLSQGWWMIHLLLYFYSAFCVNAQHSSISQEYYTFFNLFMKKLLTQFIAEITIHTQGDKRNLLFIICIESSDKGK